jgi:hypothetical protein
MATKHASQHKRMAMGETPVAEHMRGGQKVQGYSRGGVVGSTARAVSVVPSGKATNPIRAAKAMNGIPGMKSGGCVKK